MERPRPRPPCGRVTERIALREAVEDERQQFRRDTLAGVGDRDDRARADAGDAERDAAAGRRELDRVGDQIPDHLLQAIGIAEHGALEVSCPP